MDDQMNNGSSGPVDENLHNEEVSQNEEAPQVLEPEVIQEAPSMELEGNTRLLCGFSHLGNVFAPFTFLSGFASLIIYFVCMEKDDKNLNFQAKQAFIVFLIMLTLGVAVTVLSFVTCGFGGCIFGPVGLILGLALFGYSIYITVVVFMGKNYRIPYVAEWADKYGK